MVIYLNPKELYQIFLERRESFDLIDIRSRWEYGQFHIPDSQILSIDERCFIDYVPSKKDGVFYCSTSTRTLDYIDDIKEIPYINHYILLGGINSWKKLLLPICSGKICRCAVSFFP